MKKIIFFCLLFQTLIFSQIDKKLICNIAGISLIAYGANELLEDYFNSQHSNSKWDKRYRKIFTSSDLSNVITFGYAIAPLYHVKNIALTIIGYKLIDNK